MAQRVQFGRPMRLPIVPVLLAFAAAACARKPAPTANVSSATTTAKTSPEVALAKTEDAHGSRKKKGLEVPVYVDGKPVGVLRHGELPALERRASTARGTKEARYYRLTEYLAALGVPTDRVRSVHVRGNGNRIGSVDGDELNREADRFVFDFMQKDTGIARSRWDTTGLRNTFRVEEIRALLVYVDREVPALAPQRTCYLEDGECSEKVPYATDEVLKGTRVYLDGKLIGQVKRRRLGDDLVVGKNAAGLHQFDLAKLLGHFGVDVARAGAVELVSGDDVVGRARGAALGAARGATFVILPHTHGRVRLDVPTAWKAPELPGQEDVRDAEVTAVLVYRATVPKDRSLTPLSDVPPSEETLVAESGG